jgi:hypothetical protein
MIGRFLELALVVDDPGAAWLRYQQHGFVAAETGEIWKHAYGVVACRGFALGLHAQGAEAFSVVFVKPDVAALHRDLTALGMRIEQAQLGSDAFNELALREPGGTLLRVLEARSFSPPAELPEQTQFGTFTSLSLPCRDLAQAADFWRQLGFGIADIQEPQAGFVVPGTPLAYHTRRALPQPVLLFRSAAGSLHDGIDTAAVQADHSLLRTAEGLAVIVLD